jgi:hypothetical protein
MEGRMRFRKLRIAWSVGALIILLLSGIQPASDGYETMRQMYFYLWWDHPVVWTASVLVIAIASWLPWPNRFTLRTLLIATTLVAVVLGLIVYAVRSPNTREYTSKAGMNFVGNKAFSGGTTYFGVRFSRKSVSEQPAWASVRLKIGDKQLDLGSITPKDIVDLGGSVVPSSVGISDGMTHANIAWGEQNRDGDIELKFRDNSLVDGWLHWHKAEPSPFSVSTESRAWITFPVDEASLGKSFGPPASAHDFITK